MDELIPKEKENYPNIQEILKWVAIFPERQKYLEEFGLVYIYIGKEMDVVLKGYQERLSRKEWDAYAAQIIPQMNKALANAGIKDSFDVIYSDVMVPYDHIDIGVLLGLDLYH